MTPLVESKRDRYARNLPRSGGCRVARFGFRPQRALAMVRLSDRGTRAAALLLYQMQSVWNDQRHLSAPSVSGGPGAFTAT